MSIVPHKGGVRELRSIIFEVISSSGRQPLAVAQSSELQQNLFVNNSFCSEEGMTSSVANQLLFSLRIYFESAKLS